MKNKVVLVAIIMLLSMIGAVGITTGEQEITNSYDDLLKPKIVIRTDSSLYEIGETVEITYTNFGNSAAGFVIGVATPVIPRIIEGETGRVLFLVDPGEAYPRVLLFHVLEPGDSLTLKWDQQYYGYWGETFYPSEQAHKGQYTIELEYWEVIGEYELPYTVPFGEPYYYARTSFIIGEHLIAELP